MEGSKSILTRSPVILPKYKYELCLLKNLQGFPSAYDQKDLHEWVPDYAYIYF